jgi:uncharacterized protein YjbJ (UPF0337 family)
MAYYYDPNLDYDQKKEQEQSGGGQNISGAPPSVDSQDDDSQKLYSSPNTGSGFQNLDKYLQMNDAKGFGQEVTGRVQGQVNQAQDSLNQAASNFQSQVNSASSTPSRQEIDSAIAAANMSQVPNTQAPPRGRDPYSGGVRPRSPGQKPPHARDPLSSGGVPPRTLPNATPPPPELNPEQFQGWAHQEYQGPRSIYDVEAGGGNNFWSGVNKAGAEAKALGTDAGRFALLDQYFGRANYNFGQKGLDNLLLQGAGIGDEKKALQGQAAQLKSQAGSKAQDLQNYADQKARGVSDSAKYARDSVGIDEAGNITVGSGALGKLYSDVDGSLKEQNDQRNALNDRLYSQLTGKSPWSAEDLDLFGLDDGDRLWNVRPEDYFTRGNNLAATDVMSSEQKARYQALAQLAGIDGTLGEGKGSGPYSFRGDDFKQAIDEGQREYFTALKNEPVQFNGGQEIDLGFGGPVTLSFEEASQWLQNPRVLADPALTGRIEAALAMAGQKVQELYGYGNQVHQGSGQYKPVGAGKGSGRV